jgi:hypothetical protein
LGALAGKCLMVIRYLIPPQEYSKPLPPLPPLGSSLDAFKALESPTRPVLDYLEVGSERFDWGLRVRRHKSHQRRISSICMSDWQAENRYGVALMRPWERLQTALVEEMLSAVDKESISPPEPCGGYLYYSR